MTTLQQRLHLTTPIVQAPMAGASSTDFVLAGCLAGVLGSLGAGMMSPKQIQTAIAQIKTQTDKPFMVNLMILEEQITTKYSEPMPKWLADFYQELGVVATLDEKPAQCFKEQLQVLLDNPVPVASFTFGILDKVQVDALHAVGSLVIGTANTLEEVLAWQAVGADAVTVQGVEAGGHQGGWLGRGLPIKELLTQAKNTTDIPLIAAGGIGTWAHIQTLLEAGAQLVAIGTRFLTTDEAPIHELWQQKLLSSTSEQTQPTRLFSGKTARGIVNGYMTRFSEYESLDLPIYPTLNAMTKSLRAHGNKTANAELMSLWAGTAVQHCKRQSIKDLVAELTTKP